MDGGQQPSSVCSCGSRPGCLHPRASIASPDAPARLSPGMVEGPVMRTQAPGRGELRKDTRGPSRTGLPVTSPAATALTVLPPWLGARAQCPATLHPGPGFTPPHLVCGPARSVVTAGLWAPCPSLLVGQVNGGEAPAVPGGSLGPVSPRVTKAHAAQETPQWAPRTPRPPPLPSQDGPPHQVTCLAPWMCHPSAQVPQAIRSGQQLPACDFIGEQAVGSGEPGGAWGPPAQGSCLVSAAWGLQTLPVSTRSWPWQLLAAPPPPRHRGLGAGSACRAPPQAP